MLLGGSNCQLSAARAVKAMGHRLVLADYLPCPPAQSLCDTHVQVSTFDAQGCIQAAKAQHVDGVFTVGTDQPVYTAALVAEALGLPSPITADTALRATNKHAMKECFDRWHVPNLPYTYLAQGQSASTLRTLTPPLVIKPLDSQGQRGVFRVQTAQQAVDRLSETLSFSRESTALVERFYPSDEVTLSCYVHAGHVYPLTLTDRQHVRDSIHIGICAAHRYPSVHASRTTEINAIAQQVAFALGVTEGCLYIQLLIGDQGIFVNEAACRIGGAFEDAFIPWLTGFPIMQAVIHAALGQPLDAAPLLHPPEITPGTQISVQMLFCKPGTVAYCTPLQDVLAMPGVLTAGYNFTVDDMLPAMENATARFGHCVLATQAGDMATLVDAMYRQLHVLDAQRRSLLIPRAYAGE